MGPILDSRYSSRLNAVEGTADATFNLVEAGGDIESLTGAKAAADCSRTAMSTARYVNLAMFFCCYCLWCYVNQTMYLLVIFYYYAT